MNGTRPVPRAELDQLANGEHGHPHGVLGPHLHEGAVTVRVLKPLAASVAVVYGDVSVPLEHEHAGVWVGVLPDAGNGQKVEVPDYRLHVDYGQLPIVVDDPYRFLPTLGEVDLHLINEGRHEELWQVLGARVHHYETPLGGTISGTAFAVWAPLARGVRLKGSFNDWDSRAHPMRQLGESGVWELFLPDVGAGARYKFEILGADGEWREKADPMAFHTEVPPATASVVFESTYTWGDDDWMAARASRKPVQEAMSVYEMHLGSWRKRGGEAMTYAEVADELIPYLTDLGFTHVEFLPVMEHPFGGSWGYQVTSYFAPTARLGDPDGFRYLVDRLHQAGIGVIVDWVPAHFPKDVFALARFDGTPLYEDPNPSRGEHPDWGTYVFNFGRREVRNFLVANALYWLVEFHVDGLRVDAVASMLYLDYSREPDEWSPNVHGGRENLEAVQFLQEMNATVGKRVPGAITIAEESTSWEGVTRPTTEGGLGFGFKWNMGWMHDSLGYFQHDPIHRSHHHSELTFSIVYAWSENFVLPISHDEVVHGKGSLLRKMPGDRWKQLANLRAFLAFMWAHPGKQLLFMGAELGQESELGRGTRARLVAPRPPRARRRARAGPRPEPDLCLDVGTVVPRSRTRGVHLDRRERCEPQRLLLRASWGVRARPGLRRQLRRHSARLPGRAAGLRRVGGSAQHRCRPLRRFRGRQPRAGEGDGGRPLRSAGVRRHRAAPARSGVVATGLRTGACGCRPDPFPWPDPHDWAQTAGPGPPKLPFGTKRRPSRHG